MTDLREPQPYEILKASLDEAIDSFQQRERRFGQTGDQVAKKSKV